jgi:hypothetical protein
MERVLKIWARIVHGGPSSFSGNRGRWLIGDWLDEKKKI